MCYRSNFDVPVHCVQGDVEDVSKVHVCFCTHSVIYLLSRLEYFSIVDWFCSCSEMFFSFLYLRTSQYQTLRECASDINLIFENARKYNQDESKIYKVSAHLVLNALFLLESQQRKQFRAVGGCRCLC